MNILIISDKIDRGGLETQLFTQYEYMNENHNFVYCVGEYSKFYKFENATLYDDFNFGYECSIKGFIEDVDKLITIIDEFKINIIHVHPFNSVFPAVVAAKIVNIPIVYNYHGLGSFNFPIYGNQMIMFNYFMKHCFSKVFSVSKLGIDILFNNYKTNNLVKLPNAIDFNKYLEHKVIFNNVWAIVTRIDLNKAKEINLIIDLLPRLNISQLLIYGSGDYMYLIEDKIKELNLENKVILQGYCTDISKELNGKINGIMGIGRAAMEGLAMNYPVVLLGYNRISGIFDQKLLNDLIELNFVNKDLELIDLDEFVSVFNSVNDNLDKYQLRDNLYKLCDANVIFGNYITEIENLEVSHCPNIIDLYNEIKELSDLGFGAEKIYETANILSLLVKYIGPYVTDNITNSIMVNQSLICRNNYNLQVQLDILNKKIDDISELIVSIDCNNGVKKNIVEKINEIIKK